MIKSQSAAAAEESSAANEDSFSSTDSAPNPDSTSKPEEALDSRSVLSQESAPTEALPVSTPATFTEIVALQYEALGRYHHLVLESEDAEAVHRMRVTTRRLQAALDLIQTRTDQLGIRRMKKRLRRWRRRLSRVRNYDVFLLSLESEASSSRPSQRDSFDKLRDELRERRARQALKARRYFERVDLGDLCSGLGFGVSKEEEPVAGFEESASHDPGGATTPDIQAAPVSEEGAGIHSALDDASRKTASAGTSVFGSGEMRARAANRLEQRLSQLQSLAAQSHSTTDPQEMHRLRIAAKRLRYLIEVVSGMGYGDAERTLGWLRTLQDRLGDWHDLAALEDEIIAAVSRRKFIKKHLAESTGMLQLAARLRKRREALDLKLFPVKVPRTVTSTTRHLARSLRRSESDNTVTQGAQ